MEGLYLNKIFPNEEIPKRVYFIVEKKLQLSSKNSKETFMAIGRNFNNDWEVHSPIRICVNKNDTLSALEAAKYRIRFTIFEEIPFHYTLKIRCETKIIFN